MNINVVKKSNPFYMLIDFISGIFKVKTTRYIQIPATTSLNYVDSNYNKTDIDIEKIFRQDIKSIRKLIINGEVDIDSLALEEIEELNKLYINENEKVLEQNNKKREEIKKLNKMFKNKHN